MHRLFCFLDDGIRLADPPRFVGGGVAVDADGVDFMLHVLTHVFAIEADDHAGEVVCRKASESMVYEFLCGYLRILFVPDKVNGLLVGADVPELDACQSLALLSKCQRRGKKKKEKKKKIERKK
jgi:hypothetical protein